MEYFPISSILFNFVIRVINPFCSILNIFSISSSSTCSSDKETIAVINNSVIIDSCCSYTPCRCDSRYFCMVINDKDCVTKVRVSKTLIIQNSGSRCSRWDCECYILRTITSNTS